MGEHYDHSAISDIRVYVFSFAAQNYSEALNARNVFSWQKYHKISQCTSLREKSRPVKKKSGQLFLASIDSVIKPLTLKP